MPVIGLLVVVALAGAPQQEAPDGLAPVEDSTPPPATDEATPPAGATTDDEDPDRTAADDTAMDDAAADHAATDDANTANDDDTKTADAGEDHDATAPEAISDEWDFRVDTGVNWLASGAATGVGTSVLPLFEVGFSFRRAVLLPRLKVGGLTAVGFAQESAGNRTVRVGAAYVAADVRGLVGYELLDSQRFGLFPYAFAGAVLGGGPGATKVDADVAYRLSMLTGLAAGVGFELSLWQVVFGLDLGAGVTNFRLSMQSRVSLGVRF